MARESTDQAAAEPWVQRFEVQASGAAVVATVIGLWLRTTDAGEPHAISTITLRGAYAWSAVATAVALVLFVVRGVRRVSTASALVSLAVAAASLGLHLWLQR